MVDATGDGEADRIALHLQALSSRAPVHWQLEIESRGALIFQYAADDTAIDEIFEDPTRLGNCTSYLECKRQYYFDAILSGIVSPAPPEWDDGTLDASDPGSIQSVAHAFLVEACGQSESIAARIVRDLVERLRAGKGVLLHVPKNPLEHLPLMIYAPDVSRFVPIATS